MEKYRELKLLKVEILMYGSYSDALNNGIFASMK